jgi:transcriptional regulator with XRE-family HTH domain
MDQPADLRAQATELRRQGFSYSQIGRRLGVHKSVIARWVAVVSFDGFNGEPRAEQLSAVRDPHLYNRALELRQAGWSYKMIEAEIGVARSTLSGWLRHLKVPEYHPDVRQRTLQALRAAVAANTRRQQALWQQVRSEAAAEIRGLLTTSVTDRELFLVGLTLYWAEGAKTHGHVGIANSDPVLIRTFVLWLQCCLEISRERLRGTVHTHPDVDPVEAEAY